jgi:hypothetical protein
MQCDEFGRIALALLGATEVAHFARRAFRVRTIFATVAPDGRTANLRLTPDQQDHWCALLPEVLSPVPNRWGAQGWTEVDLSDLDAADLEVLLRLASANCGGRPSRAVQREAL